MAGYSAIKLEVLTMHNAQNCDLDILLSLCSNIGFYAYEVIALVST